MKGDLKSTPTGSRRIGFIVANSKLPAGKVMNVYNGDGDMGNRIKAGKFTLRWDKTSCHRFAANQASLLMGVLASNLHAPTFLPPWLGGETVNREVYQVSDQSRSDMLYHDGRRWLVHVASAFSLARHYQAEFG